MLQLCGLGSHQYEGWGKTLSKPLFYSCGNKILQSHSLVHVHFQAHPHQLAGNMY